MKSTAAIVLASAALVSAQATFNPTNNTWTCAKPGAVYCAADSLQSNIIIRCSETGVGQPGNCNDNLAGEPPMGVNYAPCWQTSTTSGDAACSKNCVVYGGSGAANGTFTLPASECTPSYTASSSSGSSSSTSSSSTSSGPNSFSTSSGSTTTTTTTTTTSTSISVPLSTGPSSSASGNGTVTVTSTKTPISPSSTVSSVSTAAATAYMANGALAALGLVAAAIL